MTTRRNAEQDYRLGILNTLLRTPHGNIAPVMPLFREVHEKDPLFFGRLAAWYCECGSVRDLRELFIAYMCVSDFDSEYREAGLAMLEKLPPYQVSNVLGMIKGHKEGATYIAGIAKSVPRSFKTAVEEYLRVREANQDQFDSVVLHARKSLKTLYAALRIKPGAYAQSVLFDGEPPEGSRLAVLKAIAKTEDPAEQAALIVQHKIPYRVAASVIKHMTPSAVAALLNAMSPQEVINNLGSLKKRGAMDNADLRSLIDAKLEAAKNDKRVSALKSKRAADAVALDEEMSKKVEAVADTQIKTKGRIRRSTAVLVDKSGSMEIAIEVGKQVASIIAPVCENDLFVYSFDSVAYPVVAKGTELSDWDRAFKGINAGGATSCGVAVKQMEKRGQRVEQFVIITDQEENAQPYMAQAILEYARFSGEMPDVVIVHVGRPSNQLEAALKQAKIQVDVYTFNGDYYSFPNLVPLLAGGTRLDLLMEIMDHQLPVRKRKELAAAARD